MTEKVNDPRWAEAVRVNAEWQSFLDGWRRYLADRAAAQRGEAGEAKGDGAKGGG